MPTTIIFTAIGSLAVLLWGISIGWNRPIVASLGGLRALVTMHSLIAACSLSIWLSLGMRKRIISALSSKWFYIRALTFCLSVTTFFMSISLVSNERLTIVILINYLWPTFTLLASVWILKIPVPKPFWFILGTIIVAVSISIEVFHDYQRIISLVLSSVEKDLFAYLFATIGVVAWTAYSIVSRGWGEQCGGPTVSPPFSIAAALIGSVLLLFLDTPAPSWQPSTGYLIFAGVAASIISFWAWDIGLRKGNIVLLSLIADSMPWLSICTAYFVLDAKIYSDTLWSAMLLVVGALCTRVGTLQRQR